MNILPTKSDLGIIEKWLIAEETTFNEGFYCNWNIIESAFNEERLLTFSLKKKIIGFCVFHKERKHLEIDILEIEPNYRQQGLGRDFYIEIENYSRDKGFLAIQIFCAPRDSEKFWRKLGFIQFPQVIFSESDLTFYKPLIETLKPSENCDSDSVLELWNKDSYQVTENDTPKWVWAINENEDLENPILFPCHHDWNLRWRKNNEIIKEGKVKFFKRESNRIYFSGYLYIENLKMITYSQY